MPIAVPLLLLGLGLATPAAANVVHSSPNGFEVEHTALLVSPPEQTWAALGQIGSWWADSHSYSGKAMNMTIQLRAGGCFCERIPEDDGSVEHMRVSYVVPTKRVVMTGGLGPLLYEGVSGVMDIRIEPTGGGSKVVLNYRAAGFHKSDADRIAPAVDGVLGEQLKRLRSYAATMRRN